MFKIKTGFLAWLLHRITGIILVIYLFFHIFTLNNLTFVFSAKTILFIIITFHALNGIRQILIDMGFLLKKQNQLFWALMAGGMLFLLFILL